MRDQVSKQAEKQVAVKTEEAAGLLLLMKPLLKRAGRLTVAEQQVLMDTIQQASSILHQSLRIYWEAQKEPETKTAIRAVRGAG